MSEKKEELTLKFRFKKSDHPMLYDEIVSVPVGKRSWLLRNMLTSKYNIADTAATCDTLDVLPILRLLEKMNEKSDYHSELLIDICEAVKQLKSCQNDMREIMREFGHLSPSNRENKNKDHGKDSSMEENAIQMYMRLNNPSQEREEI